MANYYYASQKGSPDAAMIFQVLQQPPAQSERNSLLGSDQPTNPRY